MGNAICPDCGEQSVRAVRQSDDFDPSFTYPYLDCMECGWHEDFDGGSD